MSVNPTDTNITHRKWETPSKLGDPSQNWVNPPPPKNGRRFNLLISRELSQSVCHKLSGLTVLEYLDLSINDSSVKQTKPFTHKWQQI